ncbi:MAG: tyrosine-type recombinase/integrase [Aquabacterium sp.]|nr:tyrosine-type recombinase/integrase [Ferruginibacter sp.]
MKNKPTGLQSSQYILLLESFTQWLQLLNYSVFSIPALSGTVQSFLLYQEATGKIILEQLMAGDANNFMDLLHNKIGERSGKALSIGSINKHIQALKLFSKYIRETGRSNVGFALQQLAETRTIPVWLTVAEVQQLYDVIANDLLGIRDKAMLAVYYGCGLRLNEGACLEIKDIDTTRKILHVRKGKRYKERFVPIAEKNFEEIKLYLDYARPQLMQEQKHEYIFVDASKGRPMQRQSLYIRIKKLVKKAQLKKQAGTHTLRHSIATHLLQSGMKLERIKEFLGHADLDSTQIYTHIAEGTTPVTVRWKIKNIEP